MKCSCGSHICYVCRADISKLSYKHFCQTPHCNHKNCNKCRLFTDTLEDDRIAMKEAGLTALQQMELVNNVNNTDGTAKGTATAVTKVLLKLCLFDLYTNTLLL